MRQYACPDCTALHSMSIDDSLFVANSGESSLFIVD